MGSERKGNTIGLVEETTVIKCPPKRLPASPLLQASSANFVSCSLPFRRWPEMAFAVSPVRTGLNAVREAATETDGKEQRAVNFRILFLGTNTKSRDMQ